MTACGHVLHPECLLKQGQTHEDCPSCSKPLRGKEHLLFCRVCEEQEKGVSYEKMYEMVRERKVRVETLCLECHAKLNAM
jgi:ribosomal protein L37AE/L43A